MSDHESLREDGRMEDAERRARRHVCHLVNSATPEPPECAACELEAEATEMLDEAEHLLGPVCWCAPEIEGQVVKHKTLDTNSHKPVI